MDKECLLFDRKCMECGECDMCDLDNSKICNNCGTCLDKVEDYQTLNLEEFIITHFDENDLIKEENKLKKKVYKKKQSNN